MFLERLDFKKKLFLNGYIFLDTLRGEDGAGILAVNSNMEDYDVLKCEYTPPMLSWIFPDNFKDGLVVGDMCLLMGHNRFPTMGGISYEGTHPFEFEHLVGAHNGTLISYELERLDSYDRCETDSEQMFYEMNRVMGGDTEDFKTVPHVIKGLYGAKAMSWWNKKEKVLSFYRNQQRPLWFCQAKDSSHTFWSSDKTFFERALRKANKDVKDYTVYEFEMFKLSTMRFADGKVQNVSREGTPCKFYQSWWNWLWDSLPTANPISPAQPKCNSISR